jgi:hypothetical protein
MQRGNSMLTSTTHLSRHAVQRLMQIKKLLQRHGVTFSLTEPDALARALDASAGVDDPAVQACRTHLLRAAQLGHVYLFHARRGAIECERCGTVVKVRLEAQASVEQPQQVACRCGKLFAVAFEPRRSPRESCRYHGWYRQKKARGHSGEIVVENISAQGLGFTVTADDHSIAPGDTLLLMFRLDDDHATVVTELVRVQHTQGTLVGAEFVNPPRSVADMVAAMRRKAQAHQGI